jgi:arylsulfatase A-like enzyme
LEGKSTEKPHDTLYWRFGEQWAIRDGKYKLLHTTVGGTQLFDLSADLSEKDDLRKSMAEYAAKLQSKYDEWSKQLHAPLWPGKKEGQYQGEKQEMRNPNGSAPGDD